MNFRSTLYSGHVFHKRLRPREHALKYSVFSMLLDLAEIEDIASKLWLFSHNRFNLLSFHDRDFGEGRNETLREYIERKLRGHGIQSQPARVLLSCYPRVLGHAFNPLSLFYCLDDKGSCFAVVHEVHNTFGERHAYVLPVVAAAEDDETWIVQSTDKELFVSPFAHMDMSYEFRLNLPAERQVVVIRVLDEQGLVLTASYTAKKELLSSPQLLKHFLTYPLLGAKVVVGIHWEALKLWVKGVPYFKHEPKQTHLP